jgi:hypothetical protein
MKRLLLIFATVVLFGCTHTDRNNYQQWKTIEVGNYLFDFPSDFKLIAEKGIDSYVGKIKGDSISFSFDFGYFSSKLEQTSEEYLENGVWRDELPHRFIKDGLTYSNADIPKVDVISIRPASIQDSTVGKGCDFVAKCKYGNFEFDFAIYIPNEIKQNNYVIDTVDNQYRKILWSKKPNNGTTGIYLKDLNSLNQSMNSYLALSMVADCLSSSQQEIALEIFKTGRHKNLKK